MAGSQRPLTRILRRGGRSYANLSISAFTLLLSQVEKAALAPRPKYAVAEIHRTKSTDDDFVLSALDGAMAPAGIERTWRGCRPCRLVRWAMPYSHRLSQ